MPSVTTRKDLGGIIFILAYETNNDFPFPRKKRLNKFIASIDQFFFLSAGKSVYIIRQKNEFQSSRILNKIRYIEETR